MDPTRPTAPLAGTSTPSLYANAATGSLSVPMQPFGTPNAGEYGARVGARDSVLASSGADDSE